MRVFRKTRLFTAVSRCTAKRHFSGLKKLKLFKSAEIKGGNMIEKILTVKNRAGIHARPASLIAQTANKFSSEITLIKDEIEVNAKSIMGVIAMAAGYNTTIVLKAEGSDEQEAAAAIERLFETKFEEE